jgi:hypothetical protein
MEPLQCVSVCFFSYLPRSSLLTSQISCGATEAQYKAAANNLINLGLNTLGYNYVNL